MNAQTLKTIKVLTTLALMLALGCTKQRKASLPEAEAVDVIAINSIPEVQGVDTPYSIALAQDSLQLSEEDQVLAENEVPRFAISKSNAPDNLQFMFKNLYVRSKSHTAQKITFSVSPSHLTIYKVVTSTNDLGTIEKEFISLEEEVRLERTVQKTESLSEKQKISKQIQNLSKQKAHLKNNNSSAVMLVPLAQFKVESYGVLEKNKTETGETTSVLRLKPTNWAQATHIKIINNSDKFLPVDLSEDAKKLYKRLFTVDSLQNKVMTGQQLKNIYKTNHPLSDKSIVKNILDADGINLFEYIAYENLDPAEQKLIQTGENIPNLQPCSKDEIAVVKQIDPQFKQNCYIVLRAIIPVKYAELQQSIIDNFGNKSGLITADFELAFNEKTKLVYIPTNAQYRRMEFSEDVKKIYSRLFTVALLQNKLMTGEMLRNTYKTDHPFSDKSVLKTILDADGLNIFEYIAYENLDSAQQKLIKTGDGLKNIRSCSKEELTQVKKIDPQFSSNCYIVLRIVIPVKYTELQQANIDSLNNKSALINPNLELSFNEKAKLVYIPVNAEYKRVEMDGIYDARTYIKISDIKGKEFFMRRTLEDAPETTTFMPGEASPLTQVRFVLENEALSVKKVDLMTKNKTGANALDYEEVMRIPVSYFRRIDTDARGVKLARPSYIKSNKDLAEYMILDWTENRIDSSDSPISAYGRGECISGMAGKTTEDLNMNLENGILSFSINYSVNLRPSEACVGVYYPLNDYNPGATYAQFTAHLKERISFKVNDGSTDKSFVKQVPFNVQNALGYGVWTIGRFNPSENGVRGREGQQVDLPVVHDFRNGKVLKYTVTGLPTDNAEKREIFRSSVIEIVESWNQAYARAFKGTVLDRSGPYITVQFAGENGVKAHIGDLDHNIIHFENKFNDNHGVLGVSQVGFNPRSGIVVADSLVIYAGNISKYVETVKRNVTVAQDYKAKLDAFKNLMKKQEAEEAQKASMAASSSDAEATATEPSTEEMEFVNSSIKKQEMAQKFKTGLMTEANLRIKKGISIQNSRLKNRIQKNTLEVRQKIATHLSEVRKMGRKAEVEFSPNIEASFVGKAMKRVRSMQNPSSIEIEGIVSDEMLKSIGNKLSSRDRMLLKRSAQVGALRTQMKAQFENKPGCLMEPRETFNNKLKSQTFAQALKAEIFFTLSHEMGHSQGLTHNFIASFDKNNFAFADEKTTPRNYSSVMDYIESSQMNWAGLGPYDVHAIRAAHTGLVEAHPFFIANNTGSKNLINNQFISIDFIEKNLGKNGWSAFSKRNVQSLVKEFKYCTDKDVGWEPVCLRFDWGTSATDIVANQIEDYRESYINNYHSWDRLEFGYSAKSYALSRTITTMLNIRPFMDELFYKAILEGAHSPVALSEKAVDKAQLQKEIETVQQEHQNVVNDHIQASLKGYLFYLGIITTPETNARFNDLANRLTVVPYEYKEEVTPANGATPAVTRTVKDLQVVEKKAIMDIAVTPDRLDTIGIEYDRLIALEMLTMKGYPSYKYYSQSLELSFMDFEKYVLGMEDGSKSIVTQILTSIFSNKITPMFSNEHVVLQPIPSTTAEVTSALRVYAGYFAVLGLESQTLKDKDNFANFFKVGSSIGNGPRDRVSLPQLGVDKKSKTKLMYWAFDNAISSEALVKSAAKKYVFIDNEVEISEKLKALSAAQVMLMMDDGKDAEKTKKITEVLAQERQKLIEYLNALNAKTSNGLVSEEEIKAGQMPTIEKMVDMVIEVNQLIAQSPAGGQTLQDFIEDLDEMIPLLDYSQKVFVATVTEIVKNEDLAQQLGSFINGEKTAQQYGLLMKNLQLLNQLTLMVNPEYNR